LRHIGQLWSMLFRLVAQGRQQHTCALLPCTRVASVGLSIQMTHVSVSSAVVESAAESIDTNEVLEP